MVQWVKMLDVREWAPKLGSSAPTQQALSIRVLKLSTGRGDTGRTTLEHFSQNLQDPGLVRDPDSREQERK